MKTLVLLLVLLASMAYAAPIVSDQGVLVNSTTGVRTSGSVSYNLTWYDSSDVQIFSEQATVIVNDGVYNYEAGKTDTISAYNLYKIWAANPLITQLVKINGDTLTRVNMSYIPFALVAVQANNSEYLGNLSYSSYATDSEVASSLSTLPNLTATQVNASISAKIADFGATLPNVTMTSVNSSIDNKIANFGGTLPNLTSTQVNASIDNKISNFGLGLNNVSRTDIDASINGNITAVRSDIVNNATNTLSIARGNIDSNVTDLYTVLRGNINTNASNTLSIARGNIDTNVTQLNARINNINLSKQDNLLNSSCIKVEGATITWNCTGSYITRSEVDASINGNITAVRSDIVNNATNTLSIARGNIDTNRTDILQITRDNNDKNTTQSNARINNINLSKQDNLINSSCIKVEGATITYNCTSGSFDTTNIVYSNKSARITGDLNVTGYLGGQPLDGAIGSGIIWANGTNSFAEVIVNCTGLSCSYGSFKVRLVNTSNDVSYCDIQAGTYTMTDNRHDLLYVDKTCTVQETTAQSYFESLGAGGKADFLNVVTHNGASENGNGIGLENKRIIKLRQLLFNNMQLDISSGFGYTTTTFPNIKIASGKYIYLMDTVTATAQNTSITKLELVAPNGTGWQFSDSNGLNLTHCNNGTALIPCTNTNNYRRYFMFIVGYNDTTDNTELHQLAASDSVTYNSVSNCLDTTTTPLTYTMPTFYEKSGVMVWAYCGRPVDSAWTTNFIDLRTVKSTTTATGGTDLSIFLPVDGTKPLTGNWNAGNFNITAQSFNGLWNGSSAYYTAAVDYLNDTTTISQMIGVHAGSEPNLSSATVYEYIRSNLTDNMTRHQDTFKHGNTSAEIRAIFSASSPITYNSGTGAFSFSNQSILDQCSAWDGTNYTSAISIVRGNVDSNYTSALSVLRGNIDSNYTNSLSVLRGNIDSNYTNALSVVRGNIDTNASNTLSIARGNIDTNVTQLNTRITNLNSSVVSSNASIVSDYTTRINNLNVSSLQQAWGYINSNVTDLYTVLRGNINTNATNTLSIARGNIDTNYTSAIAIAKAMINATDIAPSKVFTSNITSTTTNITVGLMHVETYNSTNARVWWG